MQKLGNHEFIEQHNEKDEQIDNSYDFALQAVVIQGFSLRLLFIQQFYFVLDHERLLFDDEVEDGGDGDHEEGSEYPP